MSENTYKDFIYPPARAVTVSVQEFNRRIKAQSPLLWGIPEIDSRIIPAIPGDLITILGRPGMGKTLVSIFLAKQFSESLTEKNEVIVYATWETMVEEFAGIFSGPVSKYSLEDIGRGTASIKTIEAALLSVLENKIVLFGRSMENRNNPDMPNLYDLDQALLWLREEGISVKALIVDYLQLIPPIHKDIRIGDNGGMVATVSENLRQLKWLGQKHGTPIWCDAQASREVDSYSGLKFPRMHNGQWTSVIEQASDKVLSLTMPGKYIAEDADIDLNGYSYNINPMTLGIQLFKQRFGPVDAKDIWLTMLDPINLTITLQQPNGRIE